MRGCVKKNRNAEKWYALAKGGKVKCRLHPLIHTPLEFTSIQDMAIRSEEGSFLLSTLSPSK